MSKNRDKELDVENTKRVLKNLPVISKGSKNWLGHGGGGAIIDEMLLKGATLQELAERQKLLIREKGEGRKNKSSIRNHIRHLKEKTEKGGHGLLITDPKIEGVYRYGFIEVFEKIEQVKKKIGKEYNKRIEKIKGTEKKSIVSQRIGQNILRGKLLELYDYKCAMCDVDAVEVLRASHIVPWSEDKNIRLDPTNAILLCGLHDLAFDKGLITINDNFSISIPNKPDGLQNVLNKFTYDKLDLPAFKEYHPKTKYLQRHKDINSK